MRESRTCGSVRGARDETRVPTAPAARAPRPRRRGDRVKRREFIALLGGAALWPIGARAQQSALPVVGFLHPSSPEPFGHIVNGFRRGLNDAGFVEGQSVEIEFRWARGEYDRLPTLAAELVQRRVRVILAGGGEVGALAAKSATSTIPILIVLSSDPVKSGLVASFNRPGGNVTGLMTATSILETKKFGLLCEMVPNARVIAMIINPNYPPHAADAVEVQAAAQSIGRQLLVLRAGSPPARSRSGARSDGFIRTTRGAGFNGIAAITWAAGCRTKTGARSSDGKPSAATSGRSSATASRAT